MISPTPPTPSLQHVKGGRNDMFARRALICVCGVSGTLGQCVSQRDRDVHLHPHLAPSSVVLCF